MDADLLQAREDRRTRFALICVSILCSVLGFVGFICLGVAGAPSDPAPGQAGGLETIRLVLLGIGATCLGLSVAIAVPFRRWLKRRRGQLRFVPPPGWPVPPDGWRPVAGWSPDPRWPDPPADWQF